MKIIFSYFYQIINLNKKNPLLANTCLVHGWNQGGKCREISAIYRVSEASETTFRGDMSEGWFFAKNRQKISDISAIGDKLPIYSKSCLGSPFIADFLVIFSEKSPRRLISSKCRFAPRRHANRFVNRFSKSIHKLLFKFFLLDCSWQRLCE